MSGSTPKTLRQLRKEHGDMTREQLSVNTGIPFSTLANIELGKNQPSIETAEKLYRYFELPIGAIRWPEKPSKNAA